MINKADSFVCQQLFYLHKI